MEAYISWVVISIQLNNSQILDHLPNLPVNRQSRFDQSKNSLPWKSLMKQIPTKKTLVFMEKNTFTK